MASNVATAEKLKFHWVDQLSSASSQHFIDTGEYITIDVEDYDALDDNHDARPDDEYHDEPGDFCKDCGQPIFCLGGYGGGDKWEHTGDLTEQQHRDQMKLKAATFEGNREAVERLRWYADSIGLELNAWFTPMTAPKFKTDEDGIWTCPHCGKPQEDLMVALDDGSAGSAAWHNDHWIVYPDANEVEMLGAYCLKCNGWVQPEDEVQLA